MNYILSNNYVTKNSIYLCWNRLNFKLIDSDSIGPVKMSFEQGSEWTRCLK